MLRAFLYVFILVGGTYISENLDLLHYHEAFLASGGMALLALLLVEPAGKRKTIRALSLSALVMTLYILGLKLPLILQRRLNYYLSYIIVILVILAVNAVIFMLLQKHAASSTGDG